MWWMLVSVIFLAINFVAIFFVLQWILDVMVANPIGIFLGLKIADLVGIEVNLLK